MNVSKMCLYCCWIFTAILVFVKGNWEAFGAASFILVAIIDQNKGNSNAKNSTKKS